MTAKQRCPKCNSLNALRASQCVQCGECLDKCPQGISIPDFLEIAVQDLEDDKTPERLAMGKKMLNMD